MLSIASCSVDVGVGANHGAALPVAAIAFAPTVAEQNKKVQSAARTPRPSGEELALPLPLVLVPVRSGCGAPLPRHHRTTSASD